METQIIEVPCGTHGCGNILRFSQFTLLHFPDDLLAIRDMLKYGVDHVYCEWCNSPTPVAGHTVVCIFDRVKFVTAYESKEFAEKQPDFRQGLQANYGTDFTLQYYDEPGEFRFRVTALAFKSVFPFFEEFFNLAYSGEEKDITRWVIENADKINKEFFAISFLIQEKVTPILVMISSSPEAFQDKEALRVIARSFQMVIGIVDPEAESEIKRAEIEKEIRDRIDSQIDHAIMTFTVMLALQMERSRQVNQVDTVIRQLFPKGLVSIDRIERLSQLSDSYETDEKFLPLFRYSVQAIIAAMCDHAELENPDQDKWASYYMSLEWERCRNADDESYKDLGVTPEFARRTITPELAWNYFSQIHNQVAKNGKAEEIAAINDIGAQIFTKLGWENQFEDFFFKGMYVSFQMDVEKVVNLYFGILSEGENARIAVRVFLSNSADEDLEKFIVIAEALRQKLIDASKYSTGVWVSCRASEELNRRSLYHLSRTELEACRNDLEMRKAWPPADEDIYIDYLTEYGNSLRYVGEPLRALEQYDLCRTLLGDDYSASRFRINERNRAIVLRESMQIGESLTILDALLPYAETYSEKSQILTSMSVAYRLLGQTSVALQVLKETLKTIPKGRLMEGERLQPLLNLASLARSTEPQIAFDSAIEAREIATHKKNSWAQALASGLAAEAAEDLEFPEEKKQELNEQAIRLIKEVLEDIPEEDGSSTFTWQLRGLFSELLEARGDFRGAEEALLSVMRQVPLDDDELGWAIYAKLARYALIRHDRKLARQYLSQAKKQSMDFASRIRSNRDPIELMSDKTTLQNNLAELFLSDYPNETTDEDLRSAADFQTSVVFSSALLRKAKLDEPDLDDEAFYKSNYLRESILDQRTAIAQILATTDYIFLLITRLVGGNVILSISLLTIKPQEKDQLITEVAYRLSNTRPNYKDDPLIKVNKWKQFIDSIDRAFQEHVPPASHICIIPGQLSGLPLHYDSSVNYSFSYAPSLATLCLLRRERWKRLGNWHWRPQKIHDFVVWRVGESSKAVLAFQNASQELQDSLDGHSIEFTASIGINSTEENLVNALMEKDCVKISCHGRAKLDNLRFELLVSANGQLPPQDSYALDSKLGEQFLLNWDELETITRSSPLIFSTACASGMTISVTGGERVGLERYLFNAGTLSYIAPQWPVPIAQIQKLMNHIIVNYYDCPDLTVSEIIYNLLKSPLSGDIPEWVAKSITVIGDWL